MLLGIPRISFKITGGMSAVLRLFLDEIMHQYEYKKKGTGELSRALHHAQYTPGTQVGCESTPSVANKRQYASENLHSIARLLGGIGLIFVFPYSMRLSLCSSSSLPFVPCMILCGIPCIFPLCSIFFLPYFEMQGKVSCVLAGVSGPNSLPLHHKSMPVTWRLAPCVLFK